MDNRRPDSDRQTSGIRSIGDLLQPLAVRIGVVVLSLILAVLSATVGADHFASPDSYKGTIASLDEKRADVLELTAAATATSVLITAAPGDTATPIAEKFADMLQWFLLVLCAISLEKYLVTVTGLVAFRILIPIALIILAFAVFTNSRRSYRTSGKVLALALIVFLLIPASTHVSGIIERTYAYSVDDTIQSAQSVQDDLQGLTGNDSTGGGTEAGDGNGADAGNGAGNGNGVGDGTGTEDGAQQAQSGGSFLDFITGIPSGLADAAGDAATTLSGITQLPAQLVEKLQTLLNNFIEALAYMIITSCAIPLLVLAFFVWLIRILFDGFFGSRAASYKI